jgi:hypothetical protein
MWTSTVFTRDELSAGFGRFEQTVARVAVTKDWGVWVEPYTPDVVYIEHAVGTWRGRDELRAWIWWTTPRRCGNSAGSPGPSRSRSARPPGSGSSYEMHNARAKRLKPIRHTPNSNALNSAGSILVS